MQPTQCLFELDMESVVIPKYYMQFADHELIDLIREGVRSIVTFGLTFPELSISELQREVYLIYENTVLNWIQVQRVVEEEIRRALKFHKKQLESVYIQVEEMKEQLSDMRGNSSSWVQNFKRYALPNQESHRKAYGVAGELFWHIFSNLKDSISQIQLLLDHLIEEGIVPQMNISQLKAYLIDLIINQLIVIPNPISGTVIKSILPTVASDVKYEIVHASSIDADSRMMMCCFDPESDPSIGNHFYRDDFASLMRKNSMSQPRAGLEEIIEEELLMNSKIKKAKSGGKEVGELKRKHPTKNIDSYFSILQEFVDIYGPDEYEEDLYEEPTPMELRIRDLLKMRKNNMMRERGSKNMAKNEKKEEKKKEINKESMSKITAMRQMELAKEKKVDNESDGIKKDEVLKVKSYLQGKIKSEKSQNRKVSTDKGMVNVQKSQKGSKEVSRSQVPEQKSSKINFSLNTESEAMQSQDIELLCDECLTSNPRSYTSSKQSLSQQNLQMLTNNLSVLQKTISDTTKIKGNTTTKKIQKAAKEERSSVNEDMMGFSFKNQEYFKKNSDREKKKVYGGPKVKMEREEILKVTKEELKRFEKANTLNEMNYKSDLSSYSKEYKLVSEGGSHTLSIKNTIISSGDIDKKSSLSKEVLQKLTQGKFSSNLASFMDQFYCDDEIQHKKSEPTKTQVKKEEQVSKDDQMSKRKRNKKNKKKKQKKNEGQVNEQEVKKDDVNQEEDEKKTEQNVEFEAFVSHKKSASSKSKSKNKSEERTEEEKTLTHYLQSLKFQEKDRHECNHSETFLGRCKNKISKLKKSS